MPGKTTRRSVYYDDSCSFCQLWKDIARFGDRDSRFLFLPQSVQADPAIRQRDQLLLIDGNGNPAWGMDAIRQISEGVPLLLPLLPVALFLRLIHLDSTVYNFVAGRRTVISRLLSPVRGNRRKGVGN